MKLFCRKSVIFLMRNLIGEKGEEMKSLSPMLQIVPTLGEEACSQNERAAEREQSVVKIIHWNTFNLDKRESGGRVW